MKYRARTTYVRVHIVLEENNGHIDVISENKGRKKSTLDSGQYTIVHRAEAAQLIR